MFTLRRQSYGVTGVADGISAWLALMNSSKGPPGFGLLITDIQLPGKTGVELIEDVRQRGIVIPVLVMTAFGSVPVRRRLQGLGVNSILDKPFSVDELLNRVDAIIAPATKVVE